MSALSKFFLRFCANLFAIDRVMAATRLALSIHSDRQEKVSWGTPAASLTATTELLSIYCILVFRGSVHVFGFSQEFFLLVFFHRPSAYSIATDKH